ncbi:hypothetical protein [Amycolatopsis sp. 195334CR]|uniref:hypothetical protein n=1 Tax=Amycolatopsis sp. 195334CR TaxID=2814588 RepID=UPI001A8D2462|nr:hypothetical protein [Amycolatopsis sp. 195334CR]MBN6034053.1 hypothetical protein [Amycolatopsis sp. 195334CR]
MSAIVLALPLAGVATASESQASGDGQYCSWLVGPAPADGGVSPVLANECSDVSPEDAQERMRTAASQGSTAARTALVDVPIMYWYEHTDFNNMGGAKGEFTTIFGSAGPCDGAGYRVEPTYWWKHNLSSIIGGSNCDFARLTNIALNSSQEFGIAGYYARYLGGFHDNVGLTQPHA